MIKKSFTRSVSEPSSGMESRVNHQVCNNDKNGNHEGHNNNKKDNDVDDANYSKSKSCAGSVSELSSGMESRACHQGFDTGKDGNPIDDI